MPSCSLVHFASCAIAFRMSSNSALCLAPTITGPPAFAFGVTVDVVGVLALLSEETVGFGELDFSVDGRLKTAPPVSFGEPLFARGSLFLEDFLPLVATSSFVAARAMLCVIFSIF
uniref:(northern house mosquito) hypothetical protein n=1 Tax=Culex pipiens TaxID=7175 RepID=A0A8D8C8D4_CULPI